jgi:nitrite reductase/ring-hydroxylating ferredoxin subunit/uncharacterized membrane protein
LVISDLELITNHCANKNSRRQSGDLSREENMLTKFEASEILDQVPKYKEYSHSVSRGLHDEILKAGTPVRRLVDYLHGVWLGHPLHPVLTDVVIGAWGLAGFFDLLASLKIGARSSEQAADRLTALGTAAAVPTALSGLADFTTISPRAMTTGATHGIMNLAGFGLYLLSMISRRNGDRKRGVFLSSFALGMLTVSAWLGGELVYRYQVGVNKSRRAKSPENWIDVMDEAALEEQQPMRVELEGSPVLLYRYGGTVYAIGAVCGHDGGPLEEGRFEGLCVECPWHQSVYDLRDGNVVHGPSTYAVSNYASRIQDGKVQLKLEPKQ